jgi:hypothetical protein
MKKTYLVRVTTYESIEHMDMNDLAYKMLATGLPIHHAEIFDEKDFVNEVWEKSGLGEIGLDVLFHDILHITDEEEERYISCPKGEDE